jgi:hypothetical protein
MTNTGTPLTSPQINHGASRGNFSDKAFAKMDSMALGSNNHNSNLDLDFEDALERIRTWPISASYKELFNFINSVWQDDFGEVSLYNTGHGEVEYTFVTGGWSENEEILNALKQQRLAWSLTWQRSERGGKHVFLVRQ